MYSGKQPIFSTTIGHVEHHYFHIYLSDLIDVSSSFGEGYIFLSFLVSSSLAPSTAPGSAQVCNEPLLVIHSFPTNLKGHLH